MIPAAQLLAAALVGERERLARASGIPPPMPDPLAAPDDLEQPSRLGAEQRAAAPRRPRGVPLRPPHQLRRRRRAARHGAPDGGAGRDRARGETAARARRARRAERASRSACRPTSAAACACARAPRPRCATTRRSPTSSSTTARGCARRAALWEGRGFEVRCAPSARSTASPGACSTTGARWSCSAQGGEAEQRQALLAQVRRDYDEARVSCYEELLRRPHGRARGPGRRRRRRWPPRSDLVAIDSHRRRARSRRVEFGVGYAFHGFRTAATTGGSSRPSTSSASSRSSRRCRSRSCCAAWCPRRCSPARRPRRSRPRR